MISKTEYLPIVAVKLRDEWLAQPPFTLDHLAKRLEATGIGLRRSITCLRMTIGFR